MDTHDDRKDDKRTKLVKSLQCTTVHARTRYNMTWLFIFSLPCMYNVQYSLTYLELHAFKL